MFNIIFLLLSVLSGNKLFNTIMPYQNPSLNLFLYGNSSLSRAINSCISEHVQNFFVETKLWNINKVIKILTWSNYL